MKLAVIFPGIGYHTDKPLLYYSRMLAKNHGYEIVEVPYGNFPKNVKGSKEKMEQSFHMACEQTEEILKDVKFGEAEEILFISKSVGTVVSAWYAEKHRLKTDNIYFTPVAATFSFPLQRGIVFHGNADSWVETELVKEECRKHGLSALYLTEDANHSMETGDALLDLSNLERILHRCDEYLKKRNA